MRYLQWSSFTIQYPKAICFHNANIWTFLEQKPYLFNSPISEQTLRAFRHPRLGSHFSAVSASVYCRTSIWL